MAGGFGGGGGAEDVDEARGVGEVRRRQRQLAASGQVAEGGEPGAGCGVALLCSAHQSTSKSDRQTRQTHFLWPVWRRLESGNL